MGEFRKFNKNSTHPKNSMISSFFEVQRISYDIRASAVCISNHVAVYVRCGADLIVSETVRDGHRVNAVVYQHRCHCVTESMCVQMRKIVTL